MSPVPTPPSPPAPRLTPATAVALAADLAALPFTTAAVEGLLGPVATLALDREHAEAARRVVAGHLAGPGRHDDAAGPGDRYGTR
ncbi:methyltransferase, partial [Micrococcus luteus]|nr:methyltransferase [Micrococcus luteus]